MYLFLVYSYKAPGISAYQQLLNKYSASPSSLKTANANAEVPRATNFQCRYWSLVYQRSNPEPEMLPISAAEYNRWTDRARTRCFIGKFIRAWRKLVPRNSWLANGRRRGKDLLLPRNCVYKASLRSITELWKTMHVTISQQEIVPELLSEGYFPSLYFFYKWNPIFTA